MESEEVLGWKEVIKTHMQALIGPNFAESVNLSLLTQRSCTSFDGNEIDISRAQTVVTVGLVLIA